MKGTTMAGQGAKAKARGLIRRASGVKALEARVAMLESTNVRVAELLDLVQELLLPVALQDKEKVAALVERYTDELDSSRRPASGGSK